MCHILSLVLPVFSYDVHMLGIIFNNARHRLQNKHQLFNRSKLACRFKFRHGMIEKILEEENANFEPAKYQL